MATDADRDTDHAAEVERLASRIVELARDVDRQRDKAERSQSLAESRQAALYAVCQAGADTPLLAGWATPESVAEMRADADRRVREAWAEAERIVSKRLTREAELAGEARSSASVICMLDSMRSEIRAAAAATTSYGPGGK